MKERCDDTIDSSTFLIVLVQYALAYIRELWRPLHCVHDRKGAWRESKRMIPSRIARCYEGDEEERNYDKGC